MNILCRVGIHKWSLRGGPGFRTIGETLTEDCSRKGCCASRQFVFNPPRF